MPAFLTDHTFGLGTMKPSITFESWSAVNDGIGTLAEKERKRMSGPWRVWEVSLARANNWGHAAFRPGELARLACGQDSPSNRIQVHRWLKTLAEMGRIDPLHSTPLCVMINRDIIQRQAGKGSRKHMCSEPAHMDMREQPYSPNTLDPAFTAPPAMAEDPWADDGELTDFAVEELSMSGTQTKTSAAQLLGVG